jgi:hypothetical protein
MGQCAKCRDFFPPDIMLPAEDDDKLCLFCVRDSDEIKYGENNEHTLGREETVKEYKMMLRELKDKPNVARAIAGKSKEESDLVKIYR